jgi:hypothetical protein
MTMLCSAAFPGCRIADFPVGMAPKPRAARELQDVLLN